MRVALGCPERPMARRNHHRDTSGSLWSPVLEGVLEFVAAFEPLLPLVALLLMVWGAMSLLTPSSPPPRIARTPPDGIPILELARGEPDLPPEAEAPEG